MAVYVLRRLVQMIPVLIGITLIVFVLLRVSGVALLEKAGSDHLQ